MLHQEAFSPPSGCTVHHKVLYLVRPIGNSGGPGANVCECGLCKICGARDSEAAMLHLGHVRLHKIRGLALHCHTVGLELEGEGAGKEVHEGLKEREREMGKFRKRRIRKGTNTRTHAHTQLP